MKELLELSALELGAAIKAGDVSISEATQTALDVIAEREPSLNCFITAAGEQAMARAQALRDIAADVTAKGWLSIYARICPARCADRPWWKRVFPAVSRISAPE